MASKLVCLVACLMACTALVHAQVFNATCPLHLSTWVTRRSAKNQTIETLTNSDASFNGTGIFPSMSLFRVTLAPCGVRTMHTHNNVDEMLYVVSGQVSASTAFANGSICESSVITAGQAYLYPRNLVHSARNLNCTTPAVILGFFTAFDTGTINIAASANNMPGGPFQPYTLPDRKTDVAAASDVTTLAYDAYCLARCGLGEQGGQRPASSTRRHRNRA